MDFVFAILLGLAAVLALPILTIVAFMRSGEAKRRLDIAEMRIRQVETELTLVRAALDAAPRAAVAGEAAAIAPVPAPDPTVAYVAPPDAIPAEAPPSEVVAPAAAEPLGAPEPMAARRSVPSVAASAPLEAIDPAPPAPPAPPPPSNLGGFEETIGSRWAVWIGAVALGLGGLFLVRYSIEAGLIGPGLRITFGLLFSLALLAGGEWLRRSDKGLPTLPLADIPAALTGAGAVAAFGTIYAAHALYDFIGPAFTFIALAAVAMGTLVLAGLHGPLLGAIGLVAAFAAPFLVASANPNPYIFPIYAAIITAACFTLAWIRDWPWLRGAATTLAVVLGTITMIGTGGGAYPSLIQALAGIVTAALLVVPGIRFVPPRERGMDGHATAILAAFALLAMLAVMESRQDLAAVGLYLVLSLGVLGIVWRTPTVVLAVPATGVLALLVLLGWVTGVKPSTMLDPLGVPPDYPDVLARIGWAGLAFGLVFGIGPAAIAVMRRQREAATVLILAATSVAMPLALLAIVYGKVEGFVISPRFAAISMVLAASFAVATEAAHRLRSGQRPGLASAAALYAIGALAAVAFALTLLLERAWLTLALAAMVAGIAWVYTFRPLPQLRWVAALAGIGVLARVIWDPAINGADVGETIIFNWLLPGYGLPALAAVAASILLRRRRGEDEPVAILEGLAMVFTALLVIVQVRHAFGAAGMRLHAAPLTFPEAATHTVTMLAFGLGLSRLSAWRSGALWDNALVVARFATWAWIAVVMGFAFNPWLTGRPVRTHAIVNWALLGYGFGAVLTFAAAYFDRRAGRMMEGRIMGLFGLAMLVTYANIVVAMLFRGRVSLWGIGDAELYAYSAVWLAFGLALLGAGAYLGSRTLRLASAALVALAVLKVFLIDMAGLTGLWRALSFIGLGLVLLVVGRVYQRVLGIAQARAAGGA
jgi:uncharacterized membrane protein